MYSFEGDITTRPQLESLIGHFGLESAFLDPNTGTTTTLLAAGPEGILDSIAEQWHTEAGLPFDSPISTSRISSREEAGRYATLSKQAFRAESQDTSTVDEAVAAVIPADHELHAASLEIWKERRVPSSSRYLLARGKLLAVIGFDLENGWHTEHGSVKGSRTSIGIATPDRRRIRTKVHTTFTEVPTAVTM